MSNVDLWIILAGYLLGSIPFAFLVTRLVTGRDVRVEGEGNVGGRNAMHVAGPRWGFVALLLDIGKGAAAYWLARQWGSSEWTVVLTGATLLLGHGFPIWLGWQGGKGLGPLLGFLLLAWPIASVIAVLVLLASARFVPDFNLRATLAVCSFLVFSVLEGTTVPRFAMVVGLFLLTGAKKLIDLPHEREIRARSGWLESMTHARARRAAEREADATQGRPRSDGPCF
jgi:acyl phosphate:glycerol-3-phosphate acyltransferase